MSNKDKLNYADQIPYSIIETLKIVEFFVEEPKGDFKEEYLKQSLRHDLDIEYDILADGKIFIYLSIIYVYHNPVQDKDVVILKLGMIMITVLSNNPDNSISKDFIKLTNKQLLQSNLLERFSNSLAMTCIGIIFTKTLGSYWNKLILPKYDLSDIIAKKFKNRN